MPAKTKDVVVLVPGLLGSVLEKNGKTVWGLSGAALLRAFFSMGGSIKSLTLRSDTDGDVAPDGVVARSVLPDTHLIPGFWKVDGYTKVANTLVERLGLTRGQNFFEFPYDWRRDIRYTARRFARQTEQWLHAWRTQHGGPADARLVLVAHSMGGLVSRYFLECLEGWKNTRALITFGTPYAGSLMALQALSLGFRKNLGPVNLIDLSDMVRSFPAAYQLLPIFECVARSDGTVVRPGEARDIPNLDPERAAAGLAFHREIEAAVTAHLDDDTYVARGYNIHPVVGIHQPTLQGARLTKDGLVMLSTLADGKTDHAGDGTVPRVSATPLEARHEASIVYNSTTHASLQNSLELLAHVEGVLTSTGINRRDFRIPDRKAAGGPVNLALYLQDAFAHDEPLSFQVTADKSSQAPLRATVTHVDSGRDFAVNLKRGRDNRYEAREAPLPPGLYRLTVQGGLEVVPVADVFAVFPRDEEELPEGGGGGGGSRTPSAGAPAFRSTAPAAAPAPSRGASKAAAGEGELPVQPTRRMPGQGGQPVWDSESSPVDVKLSVPVPDESQSITRHPSVEPLWAARPGERLALRVDLLLEQAEGVEGVPITVTGLAPDWKQLPIGVRLLCAGMDFEPEAEEGVVLVQRNKPSLAATFTGTVKPDASGELLVVATFEYEGRFCGAVQRRIPLVGAFRAALSHTESTIKYDDEEPAPAPSPQDEGQTITRHPAVEPLWAARAGQPLALRVDLLLKEAASGAGAPMFLSGLPSGWKQLPIEVRLLSSGMTFGAGEEEGVVLVQRNKPSRAATLTGTVKADASGELLVVATFEYAGRFCGAAQRRIPLEAVPAADAPRLSPSLSVSFVGNEPSTPDVAVGTFSVEADAQRPHLTVQIHRPDRNDPGRLLWVLQVPVDCEGLPSRLSEEIHLGSNPADIFRGVATTARELPPGDHYDWFLGLGQLLYENTPRVFRDALHALRKTYKGFPIQFITDDPHVPWELMATAPPGEEAGLLCVEHPVARWLLDYQTSMTSRLPEGTLLTVAPDYSLHKSLTSLPAAQAEADMLCSRFQAVRIPGKRQALMEVLKGEPPTPVSLLHFAGHGEYSGNPVKPSVIHLEDNEVLHTLEVRNSRASLGRRSRPLVLFNACEVGGATDVLGGMAGWAEAFVRGRFGGFIAPLWPVQDDHALRVVEGLVEDLLVKRLTVGEALRAMREREAHTSPTYLAYVYVGDVMARVRPSEAAVRTPPDARRSAVG